MARLIEPVGGSGPVNAGERAVVSMLVTDLPDDFTVIPNVEIREDGSQIFEYDVVVLAPHAVYALETKDWRGEIKGDDREWLVNGKSRRAPLILAERKAKVLKSKLVGAVQALARVRVESAVVLASTPSSLELSPEAARRVFVLGEVLHFLTDPTHVGQRERAIVDLLGDVRNALNLELKPRTGPIKFGSYEAIEQLEQSGDEALYKARHVNMPAAPAVRLRVISLSRYSFNEQEREKRKQALFRETEALLKMGSHPNVVAARESFTTDDDQIVLVIDGTEGRSLRQRLIDGTPLTTDERLQIVCDICRALVHAHGHGVVHRRVDPTNILMGENGHAQLSGFGSAKLLSNGSGTVWTDDTLEESDPRYIAPELNNPDLGYPSSATDLYALGCVLFELFSGQPPFDSPALAFGELPKLPESSPPPLKDLLSAMLKGDPTQRTVDAKDVLTVLEGMRGAQTSRPPSGPKYEYEAGDLIDGKFEVRSKLGGGGFSTVYRVYNALDDQEYALKVFNAKVPYENVQREISLLRTIEHPHIVRAIWADRTSAGQWYLVTELIRGESLDAYAEGRKRLSVAEAVDVVCQLLSALEAIHPDSDRMEELKQKGELSAEEFDEWELLKNRGIVHRDIKPQNLVLTNEGVKLIDFNISSKVGQPVVTLSGTPRYQSPDITPALETWDASPDLFAAGIVLFELLCCEHPYDEGQPRLDRIPRNPRDFREDLAPALADVIVRSCAPHRGDRFHNARDMRIALEEIESLVVVAGEKDLSSLPARLRNLLLNHQPNVNPMVREFLALSSQARRSNRGTRGLDDAARATYVETKLDADLSASVIAGKHRLVIVTGNAGDGKTAFIQQVEEAAKRSGAVVVLQSESGSRLTYAGNEILTLYDGSQDDEDRSSDDVLREFLAPFAAGGIPDKTIRIAAINEGRLRDFLLTHREEFAKIAMNIISELDLPDSVAPSDEVVIVNLNLRSVTTGGDSSIFSRQIRSIVSGPFWAPCASCEFRSRCPIKHNVDTFADPSSGAAVTERLRTLVDLVRLRRRRHLTMRDVRSVISHVLFRDRTCEEVPILLASDEPFELLDVFYFQAIGALGAPTGSAVERGAELLAEIDVALVSNPEDDRATARGHGPRRITFERRPSNYPAELLDETRARAGTGYESDVPLARRVHEASRRLSYFERADDGWMSMLPYQRLWDFGGALEPAGVEARDRLREELVRAISMYEGMTDASKAGVALWLATSENAARDFQSFRRFSLDQFYLEVDQSAARYVEIAPDRLRLRHRPSGAVMDIDVDVLEVLERLREGYVPSIEEGRGYLVNLGLFKNRLLAEPASELVFRAESETLRIALGSEPGRIALTPETT